MDFERRTRRAPSSAQRGEGGPQGSGATRCTGDEGVRSAIAVPGSPLIATHTLGTSPRWGEEGARNRHRCAICDSPAPVGGGHRKAAGEGDHRQKGRNRNLDPPTPDLRPAPAPQGERGDGTHKRPLTLRCPAMPGLEGPRPQAALPTSPLRGEVAAERRVGVTTIRKGTAGKLDHPTPDLRSDPPPQGEGGASPNTHTSQDFTLSPALQPA
jgi:hypothetical protein